MKTNIKTWLVRNEDGSIYLHRKSKKPEKYYIGCEMWCSDDTDPIRVKELPEGVNPQWEDKEPIEVVFKVKKV